MTSPGFLDFFILEANEYIEQLDALVLRAMNAGAAAGQDAEALVRNARALRGSATMAKLMPFAELATSLERVGRSVRAGALPWTPALGGALTSTVDDLKLLVRAARNWSPADAQRAASRVAELARYAPAAVPTPHAGVAAVPSAGGFFVSEASNIAAGLELLATRPGDRDAAANVLRRVRALRGVAGIRDVPPLADIMEGAEEVARPLELGAVNIAPERANILRAAAALLRRVSAALREGTSATAGSPEHDAFFSALESLREREAGAGAGRIVPIADLFYADGGPTVVSAAAHPPTTPGERFRLEIVSRGEHVRGLVAEARAHPAESDRLRRELRMALTQLREDAVSFGERDVAELVAAHLDAVKSLDYLSLNALDGLAQVLASPGAKGERLAARLAELEAGRTVDAGIGAAFGTPVHTAAVPAHAARAEKSPPPGFSSTMPTPVITPAIRAEIAAPKAAPPAVAATKPGSFAPDALETASVPATAMPRELRRPPDAKGPPQISTPRDTMAVLDRGIDSLSSLAAMQMSDPVEIEEQPLVPIDSLLYRGRAAIARAIELRDEIRQRGAPSADAMDELFDLLDLALAD